MGEEGKGRRRERGRGKCGVGEVERKRGGEGRGGEGKRGKGREVEMGSGLTDAVLFVGRVLVALVTQALEGSQAVDALAVSAHLANQRRALVHICQRTTGHGKYICTHMCKNKHTQTCTHTYISQCT